MSAATPPPEGPRHRAGDGERPAAGEATAGPAEAADRRSGLGGVLQRDEFSVRDAIGGPRGIVESVLPTLLFIMLFVLTRSVPVASVAAVVVVAVLFIARLIQRQSPATVLGGLIGVGLGAVLAIRSGDGTDFYAPGIAINVISLVVLLVSLIARRPLIGLLVGALDPRVEDWASDPLARRVYTRATLLFAGLYLAKLVVQVPLLLTGHVAALGVAKLAMGLPAFAVIAYLVWLMHRSLLARREGR
ncbi:MULTISPECIES: DUF3159 domain-containing protein [Brachybacterium]|uniref:DUF3159 domain-containing protein n=6 Tax=Brachybacterium alimentarium TaxID=47845 RepID=A0A2A3YL68_9MICO|nr:MULTISPECIES: DUF3159 domain-containing protein [Brachybacterium]PCC39835.1 hypothetical protein CIK66_06435 [Brachybacterium alimentarium]RCS67112.1 DUF3159 domain-containing protein [Brachybacterium sp. JB7]RCS68271.1 DUF3159 domain-containing protein [Brachybacterium alimentarium]RCS77920.1 DUF3159 domain-containing protein [Brachybacterium alimentarium]RCS78619.1 DUF3159 domain-containing protein [Brachybacterium alimentarium]